MIGNKADIEEERQVDQETAKNFAALNGFAYYETSAKTGTHIDDVFLSIADEIKTKFDYSAIKGNERGQSDRQTSLLKIDTKVYADSDEKAIIKKKGFLLIF